MMSTREIRELSAETRKKFKLKSVDLLSLQSAIEELGYTIIEQAKRKVCVMLLQHFVNFIGGNEEICVFNDGRLISRGKHDKLYDTCRIYKELYDAQQ